MATHAILRCEQCLHAYDQRERVPLSLPCGHVVCRECVRAGTAGDKGRCPVDKAVWQGGVEKLPVCLPLLSELQRVKQRPVSCPQHPSKRIRFHCKAHQAFLCSVCIIAHTGEGHEVVSYSATRDAQRKETEAVYLAAQETVGEVREAMEDHIALERRAATHTQTQVQRVTTVFDSAAQKLTQRKAELIDTLRRFQKDQLLVLGLKREKTLKRLEALQSLYEESKEASEGVEDRSYEDFVRGMGSLKGRLKGLEGGFERATECSVYAYREGTMLGDLGEVQETGQTAKSAVGEEWRCASCLCVNPNSVDCCAACKQPRCDTSIRKLSNSSSRSNGK